MDRRLEHFYQQIGQHDKLLHINYSALIFLGLSLFFSLPVALLLTVLIGLGKEVWDRYYGSGFCLYDMAANLLGIGFVLPFVVSLKLAF